MTRDGLPEDWRAANRATWDERVGIHLAAEAYDLSPLREGTAALHPIEEVELGNVAGLRIAHLQCHFGRDSLTLAQKGAEVVGLDFSSAAIAAARSLASELGLEDRARFVEADLYDAAGALGRFTPFDMVFVTWGAIGWLPDLDGWARIVHELLRPGGRLYLAEGHPFAMVFETEDGDDGAGRPRWFVLYFEFSMMKDAAPTDYTGDFPALDAGHEYWWDHHSVTFSLPWPGQGCGSTGCTNTMRCRGRCIRSSNAGPTRCIAGLTGAGCHWRFRCRRPDRRNGIGGWFGAWCRAGGRTYRWQFFARPPCQCSVPKGR